MGLVPCHERQNIGRISKRCTDSKTLEVGRAFALRILCNTPFRAAMRSADQSRFDQNTGERGWLAGVKKVEHARHVGRGGLFPPVQLTPMGHLSGLPLLLMLQHSAARSAI